MQIYVYATVYTSHLIN